MSSFTTQPWFEPVPDSKYWIIRRGFTYHISSKYSKDKIVIPVGFKTDFASVPKIFWNIIPPWGRYGKAALVHDYIYQNHTVDENNFTRKEADKIFFEAMTILKVRDWRKYPMYWAVRAFGWLSWRQK